MSEPIDIEVRDRVDNKVRDKLLNIAQAALEGANNVDRLNAILSRIDASALNRLAQAQRALAATQAQATIQQARQQAAQTAAATAAQRLAVATTAAATAQTRAATAVTQGAYAQQRLAVATAQAEAAQSRAAAAALRLEQAQQRAANGSSSLTGSLVSAGLQLFTIAKGAQLAGEAISYFIRQSDAYTQLQNKLTAVAVSQAQVNRLTIELLDVANRSRAPLEAVGTTFQRISQALKAVGGSEIEAIKITEALTKSTAAAGLTTSEQASALLQVSQAFNKGKLDGDEFRSVMENFPQFGDAIAKSLGLANKGLLFEAAKQGKITLDIMRDAMLKLGDAADQQLARSTITVDQSFTRLTNSATVLIGELNKSLGITSLLAKGLNFLADAATKAAKAQTQLGTANQFAGDTEKLNVINAQIEAQQKLVSAKQAGLAGETKLNNLLKIRENIEANLRGNASASRGTVREMDNAAAANAEAAAQGKLAAAVNDVQSQMDKVRVGTHKADEEIKKFRKSLDTLKEVAASGKDKTAVDLYANALKNQARVEAAIRAKSGDSGANSAAKVAAKEDYNRAIAVAKVTAELDKQLNTFGQLADVRIANQALEQIDINLASKNLAALSASEKQIIGSKLAQIEVNKKVQASQDAIYNTATGPLTRYKSDIAAVEILVKQGALSQEQAAEAIRKTAQEYIAATDPLAGYTREIEQQNVLLGLGVKQRAAQAQVFQIQNSLLASGKQLTEQETATIIANNLALQKRNELVSAYDQLVAENSGASDKLKTQLEALNLAQANGVITQTQYAIGFNQIGLAMNELLLNQGFGNMENVALGAIGRIVEGYKGMLSGLSQTFGTFFSSLTDGFSNSVGRAIVYGDSLKDSLLNVAKEGIAALISSLVKLGIQWVVNAALGNAIQASSLTVATAASVAAAATTAAAWAPAAAAVSLASYGANSVPAVAGIATAYALTEALSLVAGFQSGGYTGNAGVSQVAGVVHGKEFVMNAAATAANRGTLEAMNAGASVGSVGGNLRVVIEDHGTAKTYETVSVTRDEVRLIARDEVDQRAPKAVAADMSQPNSAMSKAVGNNFNVTRKRA